MGWGGDDALEEKRRDERARGGDGQAGTHRPPFLHACGKRFASPSPSSSLGFVPEGGRNMAASASPWL